jgi:hypothetical protein
MRIRKDVKKGDWVVKSKNGWWGPTLDLKKFQQFFNGKTIETANVIILGQNGFNTLGQALDIAEPGSMIFCPPLTHRETISSIESTITND